MGSSVFWSARYGRRPDAGTRKRPSSCLGRHPPRSAIVRGSDLALFEAFYAQHREAVFRYLRARTDDEDEALDLAATTFERALRYLEQSPTVELGVGWLLRTARNAAVDARRRRRAAEVVGRVLHWQGRDETSPELVVLADEQAAMVRRAVACTPPSRSVTSSPSASRPS